MDYRWWKFIHLVGVFGLLLSHGVSVAVLFRLRTERDRARIQYLLQFSGTTLKAMYGSLVVLLTGGVVMTFQFHMWGQRWVWISIGLLVGVTLAMVMIAAPHYRKIAETCGLRPSGAPRVSDEDLEQRLSSRIPHLVAAIGFGGLASILWLMIFKPQ